MFVSISKIIKSSLYALLYDTTNSLFPILLDKLIITINTNYRKTVTYGLQFKCNQSPANHITLTSTKSTQHTSNASQ